MSHPNEDFQAERWDADAEAMALREARWREFEATRMVLDGMALLGVLRDDFGLGKKLLVGVLNLRYGRKYKRFDGSPRRSASMAKGASQARKGQ